MPKNETNAILFCLQLENKVEKYQEDFESISKVIRKEMVRFEKQRVKDFKSTIIHYLESLMNSQQQVNMCFNINYYTKWHLLDHFAGLLQ